MDQLSSLIQSGGCSLYEISGNNRSSFRRFVAGTVDSRSICNDPYVIGLNYTEALKSACTKTLAAMRKSSVFPFDEAETTVLHILRGGLNFGLREALLHAFNWNLHSSAFISAQRARKGDAPEDWYITENAYKKLDLPKQVSLIFGDVVATGTSLEYALKQLLVAADEQQVQVRSVLFVTIGGPRSEEILSSIDEICRARFEKYESGAVVYLEGRFDVASPESQFRIKYTGTDLVRSNSLLAPEFIESQYEHPSYPIERCTIYDAGSRAFWLPEYLEDLRDYWTKTANLAHSGVTFFELLKERFPELNEKRFKEVSLENICSSQLHRCVELQSRLGRGKLKGH